MNRDTIHISNPEVVTKEERIAELVEELASLRSEGRGGGSYSQGLQRIIENPDRLKAIFHLSEEQTLNVRSVLAGAGTAAAVKYLSSAFGTELSAAIGGFLSGFIAKQLFGGK